MKKVVPLNSREAIRAEAQRWVLAFNKDGGPTDDDIQAMREWSSQSPVHREELKQATDFWHEADRLSILAVPISRYSGTTSRLIRWLSQLVKMPRQYRLAGATFLMLVGFVVLLEPWMISFTTQSDNALYSTLVGEQKTLTLSDKSVIRLDTNTTIKVEYSDSERRIHLIKGQAHFAVARNAHRPFEVYADYGLIRAVGTAFSVSLLKQDIQVIVDEGKVELARVKSSSPHGNRSVKGFDASPSKAVLADTFLSLEKGQSASFDPQQQTIRKLQNEELSRELSWREGLLVFDSKPLKDVIAEVGRYTETSIEIKDSALAELEVGGRFRVGDLEALFDVLSSGFGVQVSHIDQNHIELSPATGASF